MSLYHYDVSEGFSVQLNRWMHSYGLCGWSCCLGLTRANPWDWKMLFHRWSNSLSYIKVIKVNVFNSTIHLGFDRSPGLRAFRPNCIFNSGNLLIQKKKTHRIAFKFSPRYIFFSTAQMVGLPQNSRIDIISPPQPPKYHPVHSSSQPPTPSSVHPLSFNV